MSFPAKSMVLALFFLCAASFLVSAQDVGEPGCDCKITGTCYSSGAFNPDSDLCLVCDPSNTSGAWSVSSDSCKCLCGFQRRKIPQACVDEIFYRAFGGTTGPNPNSMDAAKGGCSADWCVLGQAGKRCAITSQYFAPGPHLNISIVSDKDEPSVCTGQGKAHPAPACGATPTPTSVPTQSATPSSDSGAFKPPEKQDGKSAEPVFPPNENQSFYDKVHEFVYGYPATTVNVTNITHLTVFPAGMDSKLVEKDSKFIIGEMVNVGYGVAVSTYPLSSIQCTGSSLCECRLSPNYTAGMTFFQCTFFPYVNGTYYLYVRDVHGNDNSKFTHAVKLVPDKAPELVYSQPADRLLLVLVALVLFIMLVSAFAFYWRKMRAGGETMQKLLAKKAQVEDDLKVIQYRYMKRELSDEQYLQQYGAKQAELSQVGARIREEEEMQKNSRRKYQLPF